MSPPIDFGAASVSFRTTTLTRAAPLDSGRLASFEASRDLSELRRYDDDLRGLARSLERLSRAAERLASAGPAARSRGARAISSSPVELSSLPTHSRLVSVEEVNALPTSFTPFGPSLSGNSTAPPTLGGSYDGDQGDDVLTFEFQQNLVVGLPGRLRVRVYDGADKKIETLRFDDLSADTPVTLRNGLTLSLGAGLAARNDTFQVAVSTSVDSAVDSARAFDGTRNDQPGFEPGLSVLAGSFTVNGVVIDVAANDSIDSVLARITASSAGVDASYDPDTELVTLTQRSAGPGGRVVLADDTSGFLAATKLASATERLGTDGVDPLVDPIGSVPALAGVTSGSIQINGISISLDPASDSLGELIDRINAAGTGATASFDVERGLFSVSSRTGAGQVILSEGDTGLFSALNIAPGRYEARRSVGSSLSAQRRSELGRDLREVAERLELLLTRPLSGSLAARVAGLREGLATALVERFAELADASRIGSPGKKLGIQVESDGESRGTLQLTAARLRRAIARSPSELHDFLFGDVESPGLLALLEEQTHQMQDALDASLSRSPRLGRFVDFFA